MNKKLIILSFFFLWGLKSYSQVPNTDIYLMEMKSILGKYTFTHPQKISDWKGYNNQPYFTPDGKSIYYVSYRNKQSDIYRYDIQTKQTSQFTHTPEDEYSPELTPDGKSISVVRVMKDSAQQLWEFPLDGGSPRQLLKGADSIAYYCWRNGDVYAANVPEPMNFQIMDTSVQYQKPKRKFDKITQLKLAQLKGHPSIYGRTFQVLEDKSKDVIFVLKTSNKTDSFYSIYEIKDGYSDIPDFVVKTLPNCEDFALGPKNTLFMGYKCKLYKYRIGKEKDWTEIADFSNTEYKNFYRIAISKKGDKIALVSYQGKKP